MNLNSQVNFNLGPRKGSIFSNASKKDEINDSDKSKNIKLIIPKSTPKRKIEKKESPKFLKIPIKYRTNNQKSLEKLNELNQLYHSNIAIPREQKKLKSQNTNVKNDKLLLPALRHESSNNNTMANTNQTENSSIIKLNGSKRESKSITQSHLETFLNLTPRLRSPETKNKVKKEHPKKKKSNKKIPNIPKFMNELIKTTSNHNRIDAKSLPNNIINIVNNLDQNSDKKIALKVNVNQFDLKFFVPSDAVEEDFYSQTDQENDNKTISEIDHSESTNKNNISVNKNSNKNVKIIELNKAKNKPNGSTRELNKLEKEKIEDVDDIKIIRIDKKASFIEGINHKEEEATKFDLHQQEKLILHENFLPEKDKRENSKLNETAKFNLVRGDRKKTSKMNSLVLNPINTLPKYEIAKTLTLNVNKIKHSMKHLKSLNSIKSVNSNNSIQFNNNNQPLNSEENFSSPFTFLKKETNVISENQNSIQNTSEFGDITFNKEGNNTLNYNQIKPIITTPGDERSNNLEMESLSSKKEGYLDSKFQSNTTLPPNKDANNKIKTLSSLRSIKKQETINSNSAEKDKNEIFFVKSKDKSSNKDIEDIVNQFNKSSFIEESENVDSVPNNDSLENNKESYPEDQIKKIEDADEIIGLEIEEKVREILSNIENNVDLDESESNITFTIFNNNIRAGPKSKSLSDNNVIKRFLPPVKSHENKKFNILSKFDIRKFNNSVKSRSVDKEITDADYKENVPRIKMHFFDIINSSDDSNEGKENKLTKKAKKKDINFDKLKLSSNNDGLQMKFLQIESISTDRKDELNCKSLKHVHKIIREKIKTEYKQYRKKKVLDFYVKAFSNHLNKIIDHEDTQIFKHYDPPFDKVTFNLFPEYNHLLQEKYFDLFKELLIEILNRENNFYKTDEEGNSIGRSITHNFRLTKKFSVGILKQFTKKFSTIFSSSDTGTQLLKVIGNENMMVINNLIMRDCINNFQDAMEDKNNINNNIMIRDSPRVLDKSPREIIKKISQIKIKSCIKDMKKSTVLMTNSKEFHRGQTINWTKTGTDKKKNFNSELNDEDHKMENNFTSYINKLNIERIRNRRANISNKNMDLNNIENAGLLKDLSVLNNDNLFNRSVNKSKQKSKDKKKSIEELLDMYFQQSSYLPMTKENTVFRTHEIKTNILNILKTPFQLLYFHIRDGNFQKFKETLERHKINVNMMDKNLNSLLNLAVQCNNYDISLYLLNLGADVNLQNKYLNSPLHYALAHKNFKLADLLISKKADQDLVNVKGLTPWQCLNLDGPEIDKVLK